jgi:MoxR-like ATPase
MNIKERIELLLKEMNRGVYEKNTEIGLALLAALAGESILLLGPPGVAKSMVARRLKRAFVNAKSFEYLMSRFSTPDEIFGPVSISRLKECDRYERVTTGYLPEADVVFLDEIWKAGPAIQNTLLTVINEKVFRNGDQEICMPLKLLVAASNELPTQGEGLEALWDRFIIRIVSGCIKDEEEFYKMLLDHEIDEVETDKWKIGNEEYAEWQREIGKVKVSHDVLACITEIRKGLKGVEVDGAEQHRPVYVSDRRWKKIVNLMKASAFVHDRKEVTVMDVLPVYHCLWNEPDEITGTKRMIIAALFAEYTRKIERLSVALKADLKVTKVREALEQARRRNDHRDDDLAVVDGFYYQIDDHRTGNSVIFIVDYMNLRIYDPKCPPPSTPGVMYYDPMNPKRTIVRTFAADIEHTELAGAERVNLYRDDRHIYINGMKFPMRRMTRGENQTEFDFKPQSMTNHDFGGELEAIVEMMDNRTKEITENIFVSNDDCTDMENYLKTLRKQIAYARVDASKLI